MPAGALVASAGMAGCGWCGGSSQPIIEHTEGGAEFFTAEVDGGDAGLRFRTRNRRSPILDLVDANAPPPP
jgi:hypothetical protein